MKAYIKYIGIITHDNEIHHIEFSEGVNIVTGRSSTGKSAILEVFDYCFGSSEFIIPEGVITEYAKLYFVVMNLSDSYIVLARDNNPKKAYLTNVFDESFIDKIDNFNYSFFENMEPYTLPDFKKELNRHFKIDIVDTDEDAEDRKYRHNNAKKEAPSYRHFTSFMLQHQNLIANKHALFYRFDEKEKKDQVIEQFKIFLNFVDAEYFPLKQTLADLNRELKQKEFEREKTIKYNVDNEENLKLLLDEYEIITNKKLFQQNIGTIISKPDEYLKLLENDTFLKIESIDDSDSNIKKRTDLQTKYNTHIANIRKLQNIISEIDVSIVYAKEFNSQTSNLSHINNVELANNNCRFCGNENVKLIDKQNKLVEAVNWFNTEIGKSKYTIDSFEGDKKSYQRSISLIKKDAARIKQDINNLDKVISSLEKNKSIEYQAQKAILRIEAFLETVQNNNLLRIQDEIDKIKQKKDKIEERLNTEYNVDYKMWSAARQINQQMNIIGKELEFEEIYKSVLNLKFDIQTFELYQQTKIKGKDDKKIYLRSMGSGANWLSSHVSLFTSLLYYFCSLKEKCLIPTILFLDQPSQVYFPTEIDKDEKFDAKKLKDLGSKSDAELDDDINAVTNLFDQLVKFCADTLKETGINPQIIITDHADNLKLENTDFESLVKKRWRKANEGFIKLNKESE
ncbi:DUF3732 domain-containing protein [Flavobacterium sp. MMS24-S5]|uniref:DUF3732 domain-containing protein n=1 Tax=Flavobacterium sp. MMS24-S5 TaxID=3416605 RepID=UPI003D035C56